MNDILRLARLAKAAELASDVAGQLDLPGPPRQAILEVNGPPVRIKGTPYYLRAANASSFQAYVTVEIFVNAFPGRRLVRMELLARVETSETITENAFSGLFPIDGGSGASWHVFQEAQRKAAKGMRVGAAMFRFEIFTITDI